MYYIYNFFLILLALIALPKQLYQMVMHKKYWKSLKQRMGIGFPKIDKGSKKLIWIHAVSMGETKAIAPLARELKKKNDSLLVFSTITETGLAEGKKSLPEADHHVFLPFDFSWIINPIIKCVRPDQVILCETDFWYNFLYFSKKAGAKISVVNGKISTCSLNRFLKFRFFSDQLFSQIDFFCAQSVHYQERFLKLGIPANKVVITGNIKFDSTFPKLGEKQMQDWKRQLGMTDYSHVIVAGSTHSPEEEIILNAFTKLSKTDPRLRLIIVPRHPERFDKVAELLKKRGETFTRFNKQPGKSAPILLMDAMGSLRQCYQLATVAIVGGSFTSKVGGHNILEPCWYGVPVLFGPYLHSQPELLKFAQEYGIGLQLAPDQLAKAINELLSNPKQRQKLGDAGLRLVKEQRGASQRTLDLLFTR